MFTSIAVVFLVPLSLRMFVFGFARIVGSTFSRSKLSTCTPADTAVLTPSLGQINPPTLLCLRAPRYIWRSAPIYQICDIETIKFRGKLRSIRFPLLPCLQFCLIKSEIHNVLSNDDYESSY